MNVQKFYQECKERKVLRSVSLFGIFSWILIQVLATTGPYLGIPKAFVTSLIALLLFLFPFAILIPWHFKFDSDNDNLKLTRRDKSKKKPLHYLLAGGLFLSSGLLAYKILSNRNSIDENQNVETSLPLENSLAVFEFENNTGIDSLDVIGKMASDLIAYKINENEFANTLNYQDLLHHRKGSAGANYDQAILFEKFANVLHGAFYLEGESLMFISHIKQAGSTKQNSFPLVRCDAKRPMDGIAAMSSQILSFLLSKDKNLNFENKPPEFEAYKEYIKALDHYTDHAEAIGYLENAIQIDTNFTSAKIFLINKYYNRGMYAPLDSLLKVLQYDLTKLTKRERNLIKHYQACRDGKNRIAYTYFKDEYNYLQQDPFKNISMMVLALEFVNKPEEVKEVFRDLKTAESDYKSNPYLLSRLELFARADIRLGNYNQAIVELEPALEYSYTRRTREILIRAYTLQNNPARVKKLIEFAREEPLDKDWRYLYYFAGREALLKEDKHLANEYLDAAIEVYSKAPISAKMLSRCYLLKDDLNKAKQGFESIIQNRPTDYFSIAKLMQIHHAQGNMNELEKLKERIQKQNGTDSAYYNYYLAQIFAQIDKKQAMDYLEESILNGKRFDFYSFRYDPYFKDLFSEARFQEIVAFK